MHRLKRSLRLLGLTLGLLVSFSLNARTVTIATGEYPPWISQKLKNGGFVCDVIARAFHREGINTRFVYLTWKQALKATQSGQYDATSFWFHSAQRTKYFLESQPVMQATTVFFHLKSDPIPDWSRLSDLKSYTIGATQGYTYTKDFWEASKKGVLKVEQASSDTVNLERLISGKIDLYPTGEAVGWMLINRRFPDSENKLTILKKPLMKSPGYVLFPKSKPGSEALMAKFNQGLAALHADGTIKKLMEKLKSGGYRCPRWSWMCRHSGVSVWSEN